MKKTLRIFSFGGNEMSPTGQVDRRTGKPIVPDIALQWVKTAETCRFVAGIIEAHPEDLYVITHGNGPQVGNVFLRSEYSRPILPPIPLDVCGADTQGAMAYMIAQLNNELQMRGITKKTCGVVTQIVVDEHDPDFQTPSKYIGPAYTKEKALEFREKEGWLVKLYKKDEKGAEIWRKVVPSPVPRQIIELDGVQAVLAAGMIPVTVGGGGIPVVEVQPEVKDAEEIYRANYGVVFRRKQVPGRKPAPVYRGVEAVVDKDLASSLLGRSLLESAGKSGVELEVILTIFTGEDGAKLNYQQPDQRDLRRLTLSEARALYDRTPCPFPPGSMGPKIKAAMDFIGGGGLVAYITKTELFESTLQGKAGTTIVP
ncbi:MAG: hypothetical protein PHP45_03330 [Elusimicrobiales bacterium]|nr:hypothetical protein [Elusimicrobiales bacterium]